MILTLRLSKRRRRRRLRREGGRGNGRGVIVARVRLMEMMICSIPNAAWRWKVRSQRLRKGKEYQSTKSPQRKERKRSLKKLKKTMEVRMEREWLKRKALWT